MSDDILTSDQTKEVMGTITKELFTLKYDNSVLESQKKENNKRIDVLNSQIIEIMEDEELTSFGTEFGNLSTSVNVYPNIKDFPTFIAWVFKGKAFEFLQKRVNAAPVREMLKEHNQIPPGLDTYDKLTLSARISSQFRSELENKKES